jgi:hypothetical protein
MAFISDNDSTNDTIAPTETTPASFPMPEGEPIMREDPTEPQFPRKGIVNTDRLNVREGPNFNENAIYQLAVGTEIEIFEIRIIDAVPWGRIEDGWVNCYYVDII